MAQLSLTSPSLPVAPFWSRGRLTGGVIAALAGLYWVYSVFITPMATPPALDTGERRKDPPPAPPLPNIEAAKQYLPHVPWAQSASYQLRTKNAYVYAKNWKPVDGGMAVEFKPFAMIWNQKGRKPGEAPITIEAESAYVRFEKKFDVTKPEPGRVVGGSLRGRVDIRGPDGLKVLGRTFYFSEKAMRLWSDEPLQFWYGKHTGEAVGLQCELLPVENPRPNQFLIGGIKSIRLRRDVVMNLLFQGSRKKSLLNNGAKTAENRRKPRKPVPVQIKSKGSFEFGVQTNVATFEDDVVVVRKEKPGLPDTLLCDLLTLIFARDEKTPQPKKGERFKTIDSKLSFRRLRAQPRLPKRYVVLRSASNRLTAHMSDLIHDGQSHVTVLQDPEGVYVEQDNSRIRSPQIKLVKNKKKDTTSVVCEGAGWIVHFDKKTGRHDFTGRWKKSLRKFPDPDSDLDIIDLEQDVVLHQPEEKSNLKAQFVRVWVDRRKKGAAAKRTVGPRDGRRRRLRPRRMLALNRVTMTSPDLRTFTDRMEVWFEDVAPVPRVSRQHVQPAVYRVHADSRPSRRTAQDPDSPAAPFPASGSRGVRTGNQPPLGAMASLDGPRLGDPGRSLPTTPGLEGGETKTEKKDGPLHVWADLVRVLVAVGHGTRKNEVREVWTHGNVQVKQEHKPGESPLRINGDRMHIVNRTKTDQIVHVYGKPAHVSDRRMEIFGKQVHLDRARNVAWVTGGGQLQLPVDKTLDGRKLKTPQILDIWWRKTMSFDGTTAKFRGQVRCGLEDNRIRCEELDVTMSERIKFGKRRSGRPEAKIKKIVCRDNVRFESYEYEGNLLVQLRKGRVRQMTVNQLTGETDAQGPGWMAVWRRGKKDRGRLGGPGLVRSNQGVSRPRKTGWDYTRIDFTDKSKGNFRERYTRFGSRVDVVYGPVKRPSHVIDPDELPEGGGWMRCRDLLVTQFKKTEHHPAYMTLRGDGNAEVEGMKFHARADTITYNELQDLYVFRSIGKRDATIWRQAEVGGQRSRADAKRMQFIPSQNRLKLVKTKQLDGLGN